MAILPFLDSPMPAAEFPELPFSLSHDSRQIALAAALLWSHRTQTDIYNLLRGLGLKRADGKAFLQEDVKEGVREMRKLGALVEPKDRPGFLHLCDALRVPLYRYLLASYPGSTLREALLALDNFRLERVTYHWPVYSLAATAGIVRILVFTGMGIDEFRRLLTILGQAEIADQTLRIGLIEGFDAATFERVARDVQFYIVNEALYLLCAYWSVAALPLRDFALRRLDVEPTSLPGYLRLILADHLLQQGDFQRFDAALSGLDDGAADALRAGRLCLEGRFAEARSGFEAALKRRQLEVKARKHVFPVSLAWYYPICLLAQPSAANLEVARKFCLGESGKRTPDADSPWGRWVHAIGVRTGAAELQARVLTGTPLRLWGHFGFADLWQVMLAAWLGAEALGIDGKSQAQLAELVASLRLSLRTCGLHALEQQLDAAWVVLRGQDAPEGFFVAGRRERWRDVLASLQSLTEADSVGEKSDSRVLWSIGVARDGRLESVLPLEQTRGTRGWNKPKSITLSKVAGNKALPPYDAKVARCLRPDRYHAKRFEIDRAAAIAALVGHPHVVLAEAPEQFVELIEGSPELEVLRQGGGFQLRINPEPHAEPPGAYYPNAEDRREAEALLLISVLRDSPQRLRVIRLSEAQRRATQLLGKRFEVPVEAQDELQQTLHGLARHFQVHSDSTAAAREVEAEARLRAELSPAGESLMLRLVAAPLGADGPRLAPASGRERIMAALAGESVGARRDLAAERTHLEAVLQALPFLEDPELLGGCEWLLNDPEEALAAVEVLPSLPALVAVDWPKGKSVRVVTVDPAKLGMKLTSQRDWFQLSGQARLDGGLVLAFETLLEAARGKSRFIAMGDGTYAALTRALKERLAELAAVAETSKHGTRVPRLATGWLEATLDGIEVDYDADYRAAIERLHAAQDSLPVLPSTLQAELRPYQEDGYQWAMRLAQAGFGACLADDMGLGKTLQALAVLLARAPDGPALVVAPTSVCGNWLAEIDRFAPSLNAAIYGEAGRDELLARAGPLDVVIVSYTLLQQAGERFAARRWHSLIADEAQAVKNAAAKRSQALFELDAGFRMALSGTPVENRLAELWSIMHFANPGLLGSLTRFNERFSGPIERSRDREAQRLLRRLIAPFVLRRTKGQVLQELPERTELVLDIVPEAAEAAHYEALRRQAVADIEASLESANPAVAKFNILAQLTRLRRAACDPRLVTRDSVLVGAKVQAFAELAAELADNGHKALVFSQFVDFLQLLRAPLDAAGIAYQYLDGATPAAERTRRVAAFQAGVGDLFLISLKAGGFGLNLTAADYVVITDPWWNPAAEDQAMGRAHRMGQLRPVTVYRLVTQGSIEARILELHGDKRALAEGVLSGEESAALPSTDDLIALMRGD